MDNVTEPQFERRGSPQMAVHPEPAGNPPTTPGPGQTHSAPLPPHLPGDAGVWW